MGGGEDVWWEEGAEPEHGCTKGADMAVILTHCAQNVGSGEALQRKHTPIFPLVFSDFYMIQTGTNAMAPESVLYFYFDKF